MVQGKIALKNTSPRKILGFNGLRAVAVCLVFIEHKAKIDTVDFGWLGVWLFFALSGFLIIGILNRTSLGCEEGQTSRKDAIIRFFARRTLRIFPVYYLTLAVCAMIYGVAVHVGNDRVASIFIGGWGGLGLHALYLSNLFTAFYHNYLGILAHFWTLSIEEQFYLIIAPLLLMIAARHHKGICTVGLLIAVATQYGLVLSGADAVFVRTFSINAFGVMFAGGLCVMAGPSFRKAFAGSRVLLLVPIAVLALSISRALWAPVMPAVASATLDVAMMGCAAFVVLWIAENQGSSLVRVLELRPIEYLGRISYGFYLYHMFIPNLGNGGKVATALHLPDQSVIVKAAGFLLSFAISVLLAHLSWRYVEQPILRLKDLRKSRVSAS